MAPVRNEIFMNFRFLGRRFSTIPARSVQNPPAAPIPFYKFPLLWYDHETTTPQKGGSAMAELLLPGEIVSMTARAANRLVAGGNGDAALLYLHLLARGGKLDAAAARKSLHWDEARLEEGWKALVSLGLADGEAGPAQAAPPPEAPPGPPDYTAADITRELEDKASTFPGLVNEVQRRLGKILSTADLKSLYTLYDYLALPAEVICLLVSWCVEEFQRKYGPGHKPRMSQIQNLNILAIGPEGEKL